MLSLEQKDNVVAPVVFPCEWVWVYLCSPEIGTRRLEFGEICRHSPTCCHQSDPACSGGSYTDLELSTADHLSL